MFKKGRDTVGEKRVLLKFLRARFLFLKPLLIFKHSFDI